MAHLGRSTEGRLIQDFSKPRSTNKIYPSVKMSNGYILPEGKLTPNALFVGGIDLKFNENEIRDFFARYGSVKEVKIISYRGGVCKGYGFVYFNDEVNIQSIVEISFKGRILKLGPAIMKDRNARAFATRPVALQPWINPQQYYYCTNCTPMTGGVAQPLPINNGGNPYIQPYIYNNLGGVMIPQMPINYGQTPYAYQYPPPPPPPLMADHRTGAVSEHCGLWSPDYGDRTVVHRN